MAVFTINQVRHLYVAKTLKSGTALLESDAAGSILPKADKDKTMLWFQYMSPAGIVASDKINLDKIISTKATSSASMAHPLMVKKLTLDSNVSATPVAGQEYIIRLAFRQYIGLSEEDQYFKYGLATATSGMSASDLYKKLALSVVKNIKDTTPLVKVYLATSSDNVEVTVNTKEASLNGTYTGILFEQVEQKWILGKMPQAFIPFEVQTVPITVGGLTQNWGKVEDQDPKNKVENGHLIADLEYLKYHTSQRGLLNKQFQYYEDIPYLYKYHLQHPCRNIQGLQLGDHFLLYFQGLGLQLYPNSKLSHLQ